jgi:hypothetical protein
MAIERTFSIIKPAAVAAWTDFRANQINGDIYVARSH